MSDVAKVAKTATLDIKDRLVLLGLMPDNASLATLKIVRKIMDDIGLSDDEAKAVNLRQGADGQTQWDIVTVLRDADGKPLQDDTGKLRTEPIPEAQPREFGFAGFATKLIIERLQKLNKEEKLTLDHVGLCEQFGIE